MAGVRTVADVGGAGHFFSSLPPFTKLMVLTWFSSAVLFAFGGLPVADMALQWPFIARKLQFWRILTNFWFIGGFSMQFAINLLMMLRYSPQLESALTQHNPGEFGFLLMFSMPLLVLTSFLIPMAFCSFPLMFVILYMWSRTFESMRVSLYGLVTIDALYLPWVVLASPLLFGSSLGSLLPGLAGIGVGHLYYFMTTVYPRTSGNQLVKCPEWLRIVMSPYYG